jgi:hypothetical protein
MNNFLICTPPEQANALSRSRARVRTWGRVLVGRAGRLGQGPDCRGAVARKGAPLDFGRTNHDRSRVIGAIGFGALKNNLVLVGIFSSKCY